MGQLQDAQNDDGPGQEHTTLTAAVPRGVGIMLAGELTVMEPRNGLPLTASSAACALGSGAFPGMGRSVGEGELVSRLASVTRAAAGGDGGRSGGGCG